MALLENDSLLGKIAFKTDIKDDRFKIIQWKND